VLTLHYVRKSTKYSQNDRFSVNFCRSLFAIYTFLIVKCNVIQLLYKSAYRSSNYLLEVCKALHAVESTLTNIFKQPWSKFEAWKNASCMAHGKQSGKNWRHDDDASLKGDAESAGLDLAGLAGIGRPDGQSWNLQDWKSISLYKTLM